jgi:hypothetical protein
MTLNRRATIESLYTRGLLHETGYIRTGALRRRLWNRILTMRELLRRGHHPNHRDSKPDYPANTITSSLNTGTSQVCPFDPSLTVAVTVRGVVSRSV